MAKFNLQDGFPLLTTKKLHVKSIIHELLWMIRGETNVKSLNEKGVTIWDEWAGHDGDLGRVYGAQWRDWIGLDSETKEVSHTDQLTNVIQRLKKNPDCRRMIVTAWQPAEIHDMRLPPCHCFFQFNTVPISGDVRRLNMTMYQRSCDIFLGIPFNIASYALLLQMVAQVVGMEAGTFTHMYGDLHIYLNHLDQVKEQLEREPRPLPHMKLNPSVDNLYAFKFEDFELVNYFPHPAIKAQVAV
jgi:thymidylate synthase